MPTTLTDAEIESFTPDYLVVVPYFGSTAHFRPQEWESIPEDGKVYAVGAYCTWPRRTVEQRRADLDAIERLLANHLVTQK